MKILLFLLIFCISVAGVNAMYITDTVFYAPGTNTTVYVFDDTWIDSITTNNNQINLTDILMDNYIVTNNGVVVYSADSNYKNIVFNDGRYYIILTSPSPYYDIKDSIKLSLVSFLSNLFIAMIAVIGLLILIPIIMSAIKEKSTSETNLKILIFAIVSIGFVILLFVVIAQVAS